MATQFKDDLQTEAPPTKRARLNETQGTTLDFMENDRPTESITYIEASNTPRTDFKKSLEMKSNMPIMKGIPGLGLLGQGLTDEQTPLSHEPKSENVSSVPTHNSQNTSSHIEELPKPIGPIVPNGERAELQSLLLSDLPRDNADSPSVTAALESLLGGLSPPVQSLENPPLNIESETKYVPQKLEREERKSSENDVSQGGIHVSKPDEIMVDPPHSTEPQSDSLEHDVQAQAFNMDNRTINPQEAEFELDSSPIQSSSEDDSDSDDSSSSEDSAGEDYKLLNPEEQARILMEGDGGSDDEGGSKGVKSSGSQLRTKNEVSEEIIPRPDVTITPQMRIEELGDVEAVVENILLIKAKTSGEYRVLESGSVLCLADRTVIGVVSETLGRVQQPLYSVKFTNAEEIAKAGLAPRTKVFYSEQHSTYVFTQALKAYKGSDASNLHDEEVGDEEIEFSDDEAEAEHKRKLKQKKMERRGGKMQQNSGPNRHEHPPQQQQTVYDPVVGLSYDDEEDGPYRPLPRPAGFADLVGRSEAPQERVEYASQDGRGNKTNHSQNQHRESHDRGRGRGDRGRGRGDRGRGHDRGRGRGNTQEPRNNGYQQLPPEHRKQGYSRPPQGSPMSPHPLANSYNYYNQAAQDHYSHQQPQPPLAYPTPPFQVQQQAYVQQQYQYPQQYAATVTPPNGWPNMAPSPTIPAGAYINPAFFGNQQPAPSGQQWIQSAPQTRDPSAERAFQEAQERLNILKSLSQNRGPL